MPGVGMICRQGREGLDHAFSYDCHLRRRADRGNELRSGDRMHVRSRSGGCRRSLAGHHAVLGAVAGCVAGHQAHKAQVRHRQAQQNQGESDRISTVALILWIERKSRKQKPADLGQVIGSRKAGFRPIDARSRAWPHAFGMAAADYDLRAAAKDISSQSSGKLPSHGGGFAMRAARMTHVQLHSAFFSICRGRPVVLFECLCLCRQTTILEVVLI